MTGEVDRVTIIHLLEAAKGGLAKACADAMRQDPRGRLKAPTERASDLYRVYKIKGRNAADAGRPLPGLQELMQKLEQEGDRPIALLQTKQDEEIFSIYTDESVSRLIGCQINRDGRDSKARRRPT